jgi:hypothetical protein
MLMIAYKGMPQIATNNWANIFAVLTIRNMNHDRIAIEGDLAPCSKFQSDSSTIIGAIVPVTLKS